MALVVAVTGGGDGAGRYEVRFTEDHVYESLPAAEVQRLALSTGRALKPVPAELAQRTYEQMRAGDAESARLHLDSVKRILSREEPDFMH